MDIAVYVIIFLVIVTVLFLNSKGVNVSTAVKYNSFMKSLFNSNERYAEIPVKFNSVLSNHNPTYALTEDDLGLCVQVFQEYRESMAKKYFSDESIISNYENTWIKENRKKLQWEPHRYMLYISLGNWLYKSMDSGYAGRIKMHDWDILTKEGIVAAKMLIACSRFLEEVDNRISQDWRVDSIIIPEINKASRKK